MLFMLMIKLRTCFLTSHKDPLPEKQCIYNKKWIEIYFSVLFFNCYLTVPQPTLGHSQGDSLTNLKLITTFVKVWPKGHWEPHNKVGSLSPPEHLTGFEPGSFQFWLQCLNPLGHSGKTIRYTKQKVKQVLSKYLFK